MSSWHSRTLINCNNVGLVEASHLLKRQRVLTNENQKPQQNIQTNNGTGDQCLSHFSLRQCVSVSYLFNDILILIAMHPR